MDEAILIQIGTILTIIAGIYKNYRDRRIDKKDSKVLINAVNGIGSELADVKMNQTRMEADLLFKTKIHNLIRNKTVHFANMFGLAGEEYTKPLYHFAEMFEEFAVDYYYSDFRKKSQNDKDKFELINYINGGLRRMQDGFLHFIKKVFQEPKYDNKTKPVFFAQLVEASPCFRTHAELLSMNMIKNGYTSDSFQAEVASFLSAFYAEYSVEAKKYIKNLKELTEADI